LSLVEVPSTRLKPFHQLILPETFGMEAASSR
jgi:hypothetical protein